MTNPKLPKEEKYEDESGIALVVQTKDGEVRRVKITEAGRVFAERMKIFPERVISRAMINDSRSTAKLPLGTGDEKVYAGLDRLEKARRVVLEEQKREM